MLNSIEINEQEIIILGCYLPLKNLEKIKNKLINYNTKNFLFNNMIKMQIKEPLKETELKTSLAVKFALPFQNFSIRLVIGIISF